MATEKASCPKCGQEVELGGMTFEENMMLVSDHRVIATSRKFKPVCPKCGPIPNVHRIEHHGTIARKRMKALFPKAQLKRLWDALPKDERKLFNETLSGKRIAKDGEVQRWLQVLSGVSGAERAAKR
jgi:hypothetical protein